MGCQIQVIIWLYENLNNFFPIIRYKYSTNYLNILLEKMFPMIDI